MTGHPLMIRYLIDPANAITAIGLALSVVAIALVLNQHMEVAVAVVLWALMADHLDGIVAKRTKNRSACMAGIGQMMDSLADLVSAGVFPAILPMAIAGVHWWTVIVAILATGASALRLAVFHALPQDEDRFIGIPTSWVVPIVALLFLMRGVIPEPLFGISLAASLIAFAALQTSSLRAPKLAGRGYLFIILYCSVSSLILTLRGTVR